MFLSGRCWLKTESLILVRFSGRKKSVKHFVVKVKDITDEIFLVKYLGKCLN